MADSKLTALSEISVPDFSDDVYLVDDTGPTSYKCGTDRLMGILNHVCQGRLTLTSGTAITTADVTGATTIYFTPFNGQCISLYDGTRWRMYTFTELTLAVGTLTSGLPYDVYVNDNAGTLTLEALAWTNGTTRATALALQNGVYCKTGALTRRWLGTFYTTATTTTEDSLAKRFVYNWAHRVPRSGFKNDATGHTYNSATARSWNNSAANQIEFILGQPTDIQYALYADMTPANPSGSPAVYAIPDWSSGAGDSTDSVLGNFFSGRLLDGTTVTKRFAAGYHTIRVIEVEFGASVSTYDGFRISANLMI